MSAALLIGGFLFSGIGFVAFVFGKKQARLKTALLGVMLMAFPYFVYDTVMLYAIGAVLTIRLFVFVD